MKKYKVLYDTLINKEHTPKDSEITFELGTDENYIKRLITSKVIELVNELDKETPKAKDKKTDKLNDK